MEYCREELNLPLFVVVNNPKYLGESVLVVEENLFIKKINI